MLGLKRGTVKLVTHNPMWVRSFEEESKKIKRILKDRILDIQHIGSTAIPTILSKPIIDIGVIVSSLKTIENDKKKLEKIGYKIKDEARKDRLFFTKGPEEERTHYLHIGELGSRYVEDMILFRDYLYLHKNIAKEYSELKKRLGDIHKENREKYTKEKKEFIQKVLVSAKGERA